MSIPKKTRVLVVGGGPAGSTVATFLAKQGIDVVLFEKEIFPRYHVGESLIVSVQPIIDLLGLRKDIDEYGFTKKKGVYWQWGNEEWFFDWKNLQYDYSYHVKREDFDNILLNNSEKHGVNVFQGIRVDEIQFDGDQPKSATWSKLTTKDSGTISFDYLVDASGRARIMANRYLKSINYLEAFQNVAIWGYWKNTKIPTTDLQGPLTVGSIQYGWLWGIPLKDETMSIGLVIHKDRFTELKKDHSLEEIYLRGIRESDIFTTMTEKSELVTSVKVEKDYSYLSTKLTGPGYFLVGDSGCFIDPLLSSGVHLAMHSALLAAASIASVLAGDIDELAARDFYQRSYQSHFFRWALLVSGFYEVNKSKEDCFWRAQQLSSNEVASLNISSLDMKQVFATLVSGLIDFEELSDSAVLEDATGRIENYYDKGNKDHTLNIQDKLNSSNKKIFQYLNRVQKRDPIAAKQRYQAGGNETFMVGLDEENAVNELYVSTSPFIRLAKTETVEA